MRIKKLLITIVLYGIAFVIGYFVNFYLTRYITDNVGTEAYGFVTLCKTIASYAVIGTTALNSYASRYITISYHKGDIEQANIYFNTVFWTNFVIGTVLFLLSIVFSSFIDVILKVPDYLTNDVTFLFVFIFLNLFITLASTAFQASAYIKDKLLVVSVFKCASFLAEAITLLGLFAFLPAKVFYTGIGIIVATLVNFCGFFLIKRKYTSNLKINIKQFRFEAIQKLLVAGIWNSFNSLGNTLNSGLDLLVSNSLLSGLAMGQVSIVKNIVNIFGSLYQMVAQPFQPRFLKSYADENSRQLYQDLKLSMKISGLISNIAFACVVGVGLAYYKLWLPNQDVDLLYYLTIIAVATSVVEGAVYPLYYIYTLTVKNKLPALVTIIGGLFNVLGMIILIKYLKLGIYSVFLTTAFVMLIITGVFNPIYMAKCLKIKTTFFYPVLLKHIISCTVMTLCTLILSKCVKVDSWFMLIVMGCVNCLICLVIHILIMLDKSEWKIILRRICNKQQ